MTLKYFDKIFKEVFQVFPQIQNVLPLFHLLARFHINLSMEREALCRSPVDMTVINILELSWSWIFCFKVSALYL